MTNPAPLILSSPGAGFTFIALRTSKKFAGFPPLRVITLFSCFLILFLILTNRNSWE